jgi:hypothetical protein
MFRREPNSSPNDYIERESPRAVARDESAAPCEWASGSRNIDMVESLARAKSNGWDIFGYDWVAHASYMSRR